MGNEIIGDWNMGQHFNHGFTPNPIWSTAVKPQKWCHCRQQCNLYPFTYAVFKSDQGLIFQSADTNLLIPGSLKSKQTFSIHFHILTLITASNHSPKAYLQLILHKLYKRVWPATSMLYSTSNSIASSIIN